MLNIQVSFQIKRSIWPYMQAIFFFVHSDKISHNNSWFSNSDQTCWVTYWYINNAYKKNNVIDQGYLNSSIKFPVNISTTYWICDKFVQLLKLKKTNLVCKKTNTMVLNKDLNRTEMIILHWENNIICAILLTKR